jgi:hypothetical protein
MHDWASLGDCTGGRGTADALQGPSFYSPARPTSVLVVAAVVVGAVGVLDGLGVLGVVGVGVGVVMSMIVVVRVRFLVLVEQGRAYCSFS